MKKFFLILHILIIWIYTFAQRITIVDSLSGKSVPYVRIEWETDFTYTNPDGSFLYKKNYGKIRIKHIGYKEKIILPVKDTILLIPDSITLPGITVTYKKKPIIIKPLKRTTKFVNSEKSELFILIKPHDIISGSQVLSFGFKIHKASHIPKEFKTIKKKLRLLIRYNIYENNEGKPGKKLFASNVFFLKPNQHGIITKKVTTPVFFNNQGLFFSYENLGLVNNKGEIIYTKTNREKGIWWSLNGISGTNRKSKFYDAETFIRTYNKKIVFNKITKTEKETKSPFKNLNLSIYLELK